MRRVTNTYKMLVGKRRGKRPFVGGHKWRDCPVKEFESIEWKGVE